MNSAIIASVVRHILTALAGGLMVKYNVDGATADAIFGGVAALAGVGWSVYEKRTQTEPESIK